MSLQTNLKGRLRNTALPKTHGLMPVFEAVVNSIQSIEEKGERDAGKIILQIDRDKQSTLNLQSKELPPIVGFTIIDNGCGFNDENFKSFKILDSEHKIEKGCRGVGRLMWLKVFDRVEIESHFVDVESCLCKRTFSFNDTLAVHKEQLVNSDAKESGTTIKLIDFEKSYRDRLSTTGLSIANQLLEHVLWYFVRQGGAPKIILIFKVSLVRGLSISFHQNTVVNILLNKQNMGPNKLELVLNLFSISQGTAICSLLVYLDLNFLSYLGGINKLIL